MDMHVRIQLYETVCTSTEQVLYAISIHYKIITITVVSYSSIADPKLSETICEIPIPDQLHKIFSLKLLLCRFTKSLEQLTISIPKFSKISSQHGKIIIINSFITPYAIRLIIFNI